MGDRQNPIWVDSLAKTYQIGWWSRRRVEALRGVTFEVSPSEIFGLLGANGAGKTTFIKILLGIVRKTNGNARILGYEAGKRLGRRSVGYLPEQLSVDPHHSAYSALNYYGRLSGLSSKAVRTRRDDLLAMVDLTDWAKVSVKKYSKGMLQRLGLAQALLHDPQLLILDEPTDGLDPVGRSQVRGILGRLKQAGKTIFLNSHLLQEVELLCDRVAILDRGALRYVGSVSDITQCTGSVESDLVIDAAGTEVTVRKALGDRPVIQWSEKRSGHYRITIRLSGQEEVDQCVDDLRRHGISLAGLAWRRTSLEDAFLEILSDHGVPL